MELEGWVAMSRMVGAGSCARGDVPMAVER